MAQAGDATLVVNVLAEDISKHKDSDSYNTSLGLACLREVEMYLRQAIVNLGNYNINVGGAIYTMDLLSIALTNAELAGKGVTIPYTATLTLASLI